jgi:AcrR family transcriptional regulator
VRRDDRQTTRARLLDAASTLFAGAAFAPRRSARSRPRAGVNVAAGNYHYGSKKALYLEVLRAQFAQIRRELDARARRPAAELARLSRALRDLLRARLTVMLDLLLGPPPGVHGTLMHREMCDPSEALPVIVDEFVAPMMREMRDIAAHLAPGRRAHARALRLQHHGAGGVLPVRDARDAPPAPTCARIRSLHAPARGPHRGVLARRHGAAGERARTGRRAS